MKYQKVKDGQWVQPVMQGYRMACCDCGLVHEMDFIIVKNKVRFRATRHTRATAAKRRNKKATT